MRLFSVWILACVVAAAATAAPVSAGREFPACIGFTPAETSSLADGATLARTVSSPDAHDFVVAGAVRIAVPAAFYANRFDDIATFKRGGPVLEVGRFSESPRVEDLEALTIDASDVSDIRGCRVGDCGVKLGAAAIDRFRSSVDWRRADAAVQAARIFKETLHEYARAYRRAGSQALSQYDDKGAPVSSAAALQSVLDASGCLRIAAPDLFQYLARYPAEDPPGSTDFLYWSKESFGGKPMISLTHAVTYRADLTGPMVLTSLGIYSTHYVEASLGVTVLIEGADDSGLYTDLYYVNRARTDALRGRLSGWARAIVRGRQRTGMARELRALRARIEAEWRQTLPAK